MRLVQKETWGWSAWLWDGRKRLSQVEAAVGVERPWNHEPKTLKQKRMLREHGFYLD